MVVESDSTARSTLNDWFSKKGYRVRTFEGAHAAREWLAVSREMPEAMLMNVKMISEKAASELMTDIRSNRPKTPFIILCEPETVNQALESSRLGGFSYLLKPISTEQAQFVVELALRQAEGARPAEPASLKSLGTMFTDFPTLDELEKQYMKIVLEKTKGRKERAAKILGINRRTLYRKEREYGWVMEEKHQPPRELDQSVSH